MVPFWVLGVIPHLVFGGPTRDHNFDNHPHVIRQRRPGSMFGSLLPHASPSTKLALCLLRLLFWTLGHEGQIPEPRYRQEEFDQAQKRDVGSSRFTLITNDSRPN